jgi:hypothetical protein
MKIKTITARNIKGRNFSLPLEAATIIVGPNSIGKTAVLDAIDLALLGYVPTLAKTNQGIFSLASDKAMSVQIETDEGQQIERAWSQGPNGSVNKSERLAHGVPPMPVVMLDANEFFGRSEAGRMEMIFGLMNLAATPLSQRVGDIRAILTSNLHALGVLDRMPHIPGETFQRWLERALAGFGEALRSEAATAKAMKATQQSLAHLQLKDEAEAAPEAELQNSSQIGQRRLGLKTKAKALSDIVGTKEMAENKILACTTAMDEIRGIDDEKPLAAYYKASATTEAAAGRAAEKAQDLLDAIAVLIHERDDVLSHKECPTCFTNKPTWKRAATKKFEERLKALDDLSTEAVAAAQKAQKAAAAAREDQQAAELRAKKLQELTTEMRSLTAHLESIERAAEILAEVNKELADLPAGGIGETDAEWSKSHHADMEFEDAAQRVADLEKQQQAAANEKADQKRLAEAAAACEAATQAGVMIKEGVGVLTEARSHYMLGGIEPLLKVANVFAKGILPSQLEFWNGEIGRTEKGRWIPSRSFSGAEQAITHAAISAALGSQAPIRIVLFDELGRLDPNSKEKFIWNVIAALDPDNPKDDKRLIDQFIGADVGDDTYRKMNEGNARLHIIPLKA